MSTDSPVPVVFGGQGVSPEVGLKNLIISERLDADLNSAALSAVGRLPVSNYDHTTQQKCAVALVEMTEKQVLQLYKSGENVLTIKDSLSGLITGFGAGVRRATAYKNNLQEALRYETTETEIFKRQGVIAGYILSSVFDLNLNLEALLREVKTTPGFDKSIDVAIGVLDGLDEHSLKESNYVKPRLEALRNSIKI